MNTKSALINATIPAVVGTTMVMATWWIVHSVRQEILAIAADAAKVAVQEAIGAIKPAISWKGVRVITPVVKIGGTLKVDYIARITKQCPSDLRGFLLDRSGAAVYRLPDTQGGYRRTDPDEDQVIHIELKIADPPPGDLYQPLEPGVYTYRTTAVRYCETVQLDSFIPDATFTLER